MVGDTLQLPPVNSTDSGSVLKSLAASAGLIENAFAADHGMLAGKTGRQRMPGSLMRMASASAYFDMTASTRGMWLRDHFRCDPRIIAFCNRVWYTGETSLVPRRRRQEHLMVPPFGHVNVIGKAVNRSNEAEAHAIMTWINTHGAHLQQRYNQPIDRIVAVLTPFGNQRRLLRSLRDNFKWNEEFESPTEITMGTVHALQGAERQVILFSTVYDGPKPRYFFDVEHTLLNVAVSRAKDSFIVFGDRTLFDHQVLDSSRPSTFLREHLFDESLFGVPELPPAAQNQPEPSIVGRSSRAS